MNRLGYHNIKGYNNLSEYRDAPAAVATGARQRDRSLCLDVLSVVLIAVGLSMDAFAVSVSCGLGNPEDREKNAWKAAFFFGGFQAGMTAVGWALGQTFARVIEPIDHWIAFALLAGIGANMLKESFDTDCKHTDLTELKMLFTLSVATSIDALAVGISFSTLGYSIGLPVPLIGCTTFLFSLAGVHIGASIGCKGSLKRWVDIAGGVILIGIGIKILLEHLLA
jgi:putative Mn2+ efflux pump MntP